MAKRKHKQIKVEYLVDIVIPVYGQAELLSKCIEALPGAASGTPYRLIIAVDVLEGAIEGVRMPIAVELLAESGVEYVNV